MSTNRERPRAAEVLQQRKAIKSILMMAIIDEFDIRRLEMDDDRTIRIEYRLNGRPQPLTIVLRAEYREGYSREIEPELKE